MSSVNARIGIYRVTQSLCKIWISIFCFFSCVSSHLLTSRVHKIRIISSKNLMNNAAFHNAYTGIWTNDHMKFMSGSFILSTNHQPKQIRPTFSALNWIERVSIINDQMWFSMFIPFLFHFLRIRCNCEQIIIAKQNLITTKNNNTLMFENLSIK